VTSRSPNRAAPLRRAAAWFNQALQPTTTAVTIRADARLAPAAVVADL
jgi:hypothetical protein